MYKYIVTDVNSSNLIYGPFDRYEDALRFAEHVLVGGVIRPLLDPIDHEQLIKQYDTSNG